MTVSIIIAVKTWQKNLEECVAKCQELDYPNFEITILPDIVVGILPTQPISGFPKGAVPMSIIPTGELNPAQKRDIALKHARGEILAFIDDDAYPQKDWLKNAVKNFVDPEVAAVGGPAITPESDSPQQQASGIIYGSALVSASLTYRYLAQRKREVDDFPSSNFLVRKSVMQELGGFNTNFWPGEDTKLCLDITKKLKKKIVYDPDVLVYHHRRPLFKAHLQQIASYATHRGYFVKKFPKTSARITYFLPSLFVIGIFSGGIFSLFAFSLRMIYFAALFLYLLIVFIYSIAKDLPLAYLVFPGIFFTHITYGVCFLKGLLSWRLKEEL